MDAKTVDQILSIIKDIGAQYEDLLELLKTEKINSRDSLLIEIFKEIIEKNEIIQDTFEIGHIPCDEKESEAKSTTPGIIENLIIEIQKSPSKKVLFLREFLDGLSEISENDKNVIINSLKEVEIKDLEENMLSLLKIFQKSK